MSLQSNLIRHRDITKRSSSSGSPFLLSPSQEGFFSPCQTALQGCLKKSTQTGLQNLTTYFAFFVTRSFWLVDRKTTRETRSVSKQLCHQDLKDCQAKKNLHEVTSGSRCFPLPSGHCSRSAILSSIFTSKVVYEQEEKYPLYRLWSFVSEAHSSGHTTNYLLYLKPGFNT